jgi:hypothetical protein
MNAKGKYFVVLPKKSKVVVYGRWLLERGCKRH